MRQVFKGVATGVLLFSLFFIACAKNTPHAVELPSAVETVADPLPIKIFKNTLHVHGENMRASAVYLQGNVALTARHVCDVIHNAYLLDYAGRAYRINRTIKSKDRRVDLCVLIIASWEPSPMIPLPGSHIPAGYQNLVGSKVFIGGYPGGSYYSYKSGTIYSEELVILEQYGISLYCNMVNVWTPPGNSGGGAFNEKGQLVGIVSVGAPGMGGLVPPNLINIFLRSLNLPEQGLILEY